EARFCVNPPLAERFVSRHELRGQVHYQPQLLLLFLELLLCLLTFVNISQQHIPPKDSALGVARRAATCHKPSVDAVGATITMHVIVWLSCSERPRPTLIHAGEFLRMNHAVVTPVLQFIESHSEELD